MFVISTLEDNIRVAPQDLAKPSIEAITAVIEETYIDKVIKDLGLVITLYDVLEIQGGFIYPSEGAAHFVVKFRLVIFQPFVGEVLIGKLVKCGREGLHISLGFFDDISVPEYGLQEPSVYDETENLWFWKFDGNDMFLDLEEDVRFRVHSIKFNTVPTTTAAAAASTAESEAPVGTAANPFAPMQLIGDINGDGLGLVGWWSALEDAAEDMQE